MIWVKNRAIRPRWFLIRSESRSVQVGDICYESAHRRTIWLGRLIAPFGRWHFASTHYPAGSGLRLASNWPGPSGLKDR